MIECAVADCKKPLHKSRKTGWCEMHISRMRFHGSLDDPRPGKQKRLIYRTGYAVLYEPDHPLAMPSTGYVQEHRKFLFESLGPDDRPCHWCGKMLSWFDPFPRGLAVDHLDADPLNNSLENLVPSCVGCNVSRARRRTGDTCRNGHSLSDSYTETDKAGVVRQRCRECMNLRAAKYRARKKALQT